MILADVMNAETHYQKEDLKHPGCRQCGPMHIDRSTNALVRESCCNSENSQEVRKITFQMKGSPGTFVS